MLCSIHIAYIYACIQSKVGFSDGTCIKSNVVGEACHTIHTWLRQGYAYVSTLDTYCISFQVRNAVGQAQRQLIHIGKAIMYTYSMQMLNLLHYLPQVHGLTDYIASALQTSPLTE